jgi:predicted NodU family carbamoyl transferase
VIILGLSVATSEHHAAALVIDGEVVAAAEEERFNRIKHYGWSPDGRPGANLINTPGLTLNDAVCRGAVGWMLGERGLTLADVDVIALNGIPHRYLGAREPVVEGRYVFVPHHLAHASLAVRTAPGTVRHALTIDGRGEYETAALFEVDGEAIRRCAELPAGDGRSIGGAYETVTRALGFGPHGQGQTMALAAFADGDPASLRDAYEVNSFEDWTLDEAVLQRLAHARVKEGDGFDSDAGRRLAADVQAATEHAMIALARSASASPGDGWAIAGGVALNCRANSALRDALGAPLWVPSSAHDSGTALGAALEAAHVLGEPPCSPLRTAGLGPAASPGSCERAWREQGLTPTVTDDGDALIDAVVARLLDGKVLGWVQGRMEYGPRALGHRSIIGHPGSRGIQDKVNAIKSRQSWRPFGPSVLAEHAEAWFEDADFGPFMTFTSTVREARRAEVAGVVHTDGSTRPQRVDGDAQPEWRALIEAFHDATGVPMLLNTSFNGRGEPIVCSPADAVSSARRIGLDGIILGPYLLDL